MQSLCTILDIDSWLKLQCTSRTLYDDDVLYFFCAFPNRVHCRHIWDSSPDRQTLRLVSDRLPTQQQNTWTICVLANSITQKFNMSIFIISALFLRNRVFLLFFERLNSCLNDWFVYETNACKWFSSCGCGTRYNAGWVKCGNSLSWTESFHSHPRSSAVGQINSISDRSVPLCWAHLVIKCCWSLQCHCKKTCISLYTAQFEKWLLP